MAYLTFEVSGIEIVDGLRERYFGEFDQRALIYYNKVWPVDQIDSQNSRYGVESDM